MVVAGPLPGAFVRLPEDALKATWKAKLRIFCAGVWHNLVSTRGGEPQALVATLPFGLCLIGATQITAAMVLLVCNIFLSPFYQRDTLYYFEQHSPLDPSHQPSSVVVNVHPASPLSGILFSGHEITAVGFSPTPTAAAWQRVLREAQTREAVYRDYHSRLQPLNTARLLSALDGGASRSRLRGSQVASETSGHGALAAAAAPEPGDCCRGPDVNDHSFSGHCDWPCARRVVFDSQGLSTTTFLPQGSGWCIPTRVLMQRDHSFMPKSSNMAWLDLMGPTHPSVKDTVFYRWSTREALWRSFAMPASEVVDTQWSPCKHPAEIKAANMESPHATNLDLDAWSAEVCSSAAEESVCVLAGVPEGTSLLPIRLTNGTSIIFEGPASVLDHDVKVTDWRPREWLCQALERLSALVSMGSSPPDTGSSPFVGLTLFEYALLGPMVWLKFVQYFAAISCLMGVFNALPCVHSDGHHIMSTLCLVAARQLFSILPPSICRGLSKGMLCTRSVALFFRSKCCAKTSGIRRSRPRSRRKRQFWVLSRCAACWYFLFRFCHRVGASSPTPSPPERRRAWSEDSDSSFSSGEFDLPALDLEDPLLLPEFPSGLRGVSDVHLEAEEAKPTAANFALNPPSNAPATPGESVVSTPRQRAVASDKSARSGLEDGTKQLEGAVVKREGYGMAWAEDAGQWASGVIIATTTLVMAANTVLSFMGL